jgi:hypothetical protein
MWVREGAVRPAKLGSPTGGRGLGQHFSLRQAFILALISCLRDDIAGRYLGPIYVKRIMEEAEQMPDEEFESMLTTVPDVWTEEVTAKGLVEKAVVGPMKDLPAHWEPRMIQVLVELKRRLVREGRIGGARTATEASKSR